MAVEEGAPPPTHVSSSGLFVPTVLKLNLTAAPFPPLSESALVFTWTVQACARLSQGCRWACCYFQEDIRHTEDGKRVT